MVLNPDKEYYSYEVLTILAKSNWRNVELMINQIFFFSPAIWKDLHLHKNP